MAVIFRGSFQKGVFRNFKAFTTPPSGIIAPANGTAWFNGYNNLSNDKARLGQPVSGSGTMETSRSVPDSQWWAYDGSANTDQDDTSPPRTASLAS